MCEKPQREIILNEETVEEGYLSVTGGKVWYRIAGKEKSGTPLLCLHGGPGMPHDYLTPLENFASDRPVVFFDQLGCGQSDIPEDASMYSVDFFADEIDEVRAGLDLGEIVLLGQSWGTMLGSYYLINRTQEGVKAVVFSSPVMCVKKMTEDMGDCINELGPELSAAIWEAEASHDYSTEGFMQGMGAMLSRHVCRLPEWPACIAAAQQKTGGLVYMTMWGTQQFTCNGLLKEFDVRADLDKIKVPALFVCGEYDYCKPKTGEEYSKQVADGTLLVIEDGAHQAHVEFPDLYKEKVSAWLAEKL